MLTLLIATGCTTVALRSEAPARSVMRWIETPLFEDLFGGCGRLSGCPRVSLERDETDGRTNGTGILSARCQRFFFACFLRRAGVCACTNEGPIHRSTWLIKTRHNDTAVKQRSQRRRANKA